MVEAILACALFSLAGLCLFTLLQFGFRAFSIGGQRMGTQAEAETILMRLRADLEFTTVASIRTLVGGGRNIVVPLSVGPTDQPRHLLSCCGLTDWNDKDKYDRYSGLPKWDRYLVYHADLSPQGSFFRLELDPNNTVNDEGWQQFSNYCGGFPNTPPSVGAIIAGARVLRRQRLSNRLLGFEVTHAANDLVLRVLLYNEAANRGPTSGSKRSQVLETKARIAIRNRAH